MSDWVVVWSGSTKTSLTNSEGWQIRGCRLLDLAPTIGTQSKDWPTSKAGAKRDPAMRELSAWEMTQLPTCINQCGRVVSRGDVTCGYRRCQPCRRAGIGGRNHKFKERAA